MKFYEVLVVCILSGLITYVFNYPSHIFYFLAFLMIIDWELCDIVAELKKINKKIKG